MNLPEHINSFKVRMNIIYVVQDLTEMTATGAISQHAIYQPSGRQHNKVYE